MSSLGRIVAGFVGGAAGTASSLIQDDIKYKKDLEKAAMLERLRADTSKELAVFSNDLQLANPDDKATTIDGNEKVFRDGRGNVLRRQALTDSELSDVAYTDKKRSLDIAGAEADIGYKRAAASSQLADASYTRAGRPGSGRGGSSGDTGEDADVIIEKNLRYLAKDAIDDLAKKGVAPNVIDGLIQSSIVSAKQGKVSGLTGAASNIRTAAAILLKQNYKQDPLSGAYSYDSDKAGARRKRRFGLDAQ